MIIHPGEKIHVVFRQLFKDDTSRHFAGTVEQCEGDLVRVTGFQFSEEVKLSKVVNFVKREEVRTRIISLACESVIVNVLPKEVEIAKIHYKYDIGGIIRVTDGSNWHLDLSHI